MSDLNEINPRVAVVKIGTKKLKEINIYPLSAGDQFELVEKVKEELLRFVELPRDLKTEARIIDTITTLIKDNLEQILDYVIDPEEWQEVFGEKSKASCIDNIQLLDIILTIYNNNFKAAQKKITKEMSGLMELFQKKEEPSQPDQLLQDSSDPTLNIPSEISLEKEDIEEE